MGVIRHGIEEMPFTRLCSVVFEMMHDAATKGTPMWEWDVPAIHNSLTDQSDEILACHVWNTDQAIEAALHRYRSNQFVQSTGEEPLVCEFCGCPAGLCLDSMGNPLCDECWSKSEHDEAAHG